MRRTPSGGVQRDSSTLVVDLPKNELAVRRNQPAGNPFWRDRYWLSPVQVHQVSAHAVTGFGGIQGDAFSVCQEMSGAVLNVQPRYGDRTGLTRAYRHELHVARTVLTARENGNRPFAVWRQSTCATLTQLNWR